MYTQTTTLDYPEPGQLRHGDILLPRRKDVVAIASPVEGLQEAWRQVMAREAQVNSAPSRNNQESNEKFDLVAYWPTLLLYLRQVTSNQRSIEDMLKAVVDDLKKFDGFNFPDLSQAILAKQYVGHSAIVDRPSSESVPWVIESSHTHGGFRSVSYADWEAERKEVKALVWVYRLSKFVPAKGAAELSEDAQRQCHRFVDTAHRFRMQGVPYAIFDSAETGAKFSLDLAEVRPPGDADYLYCSELILRCAAEALGGIDLRERKDGELSASKNDFRMFTPKDIMLSKHVEVVNKPQDADYIVVATADTQKDK